MGGPGFLCLACTSKMLPLTRWFEQVPQRCGACEAGVRRKPGSARQVVTIAIMSDPSLLRVATWNLERKKPTSLRGKEAVDYLFSRDADVMVLTEARTTFPANNGHLLVPEPPVGKFDDDERKVALWSATPLRPVTFDSPIDPTRFVAARTSTTAGSVLVLAVCIPWHMAEVTYHYGVKRKPWEQHLAYLGHLDEIFAAIDEPVIVAGDFNQRTPRQKGGNHAAAEALERTFEPLVIVTAGTVPGCGKPGIDHIAISDHLSARNVEGWAHDVTGNRLSDHDGVLVDLR